MKKINQMKIEKEMKVSELVRGFEKAGLGANILAKAKNVIVKMLKDDDCNVFLSFSGPMVPSGLRTLIADMIKKRHADIVVTSGGNIVHDVIESLGGEHYQGSFDADDEELHKKGIGRAGNVYVPNKDFELFEKKIRSFLKDLYGRKQRLSIAELLRELGLTLGEDSFLYQAAKNDVPVYSPGFQDSMLGLQLALFKQEHDIVIDAIADMMSLNNKVFEKKHTGAIILGGGIPKHYTLGANILKGGLDYAVNITTAMPYDGSLSGARLEEAVSWGKAKEGSDLVTVQGDATVLFPLVMAAVLDDV
jgi:deoxyhypusine synthase